MKIGNVSSYYDKDYFYPNFKTYVDQFGVERKYYGPSKDWHGFDYIARFISNEFTSVHTILDIGCSAGSFVARSTAMGFDCIGVDVSTFAVKNCLPEAKGRVHAGNILVENPTKKYDMLTGFDLMEHLLVKDIPKAISYIQNSLNPGGFFFACISTAKNGSELFEHSSFEDDIPPDKTWLGVSGHVNVKYIHTWIKDFENYGFKTDYERMMKFQLFRFMSADMARVESWGPLNVYIGRM